jgi:Flp pilus assembly protein TadD
MTMTLEQAMQLASQHHQARRLAEAEQIYRQILEQVPDHSDALRLLGAVVGQAGKVDAAIELLGKAIQLHPDDAQAHNNLGFYLKEKGRLEEAMAAFRRAIELKPEDFQAHYNLGNALKEMGRLDEAIAAYERAIQCDPDSAEARSDLGNALWETGRLEEAVAACNQAIALRPDLASAWNNLGITLGQQDRVDEAITAFNRAIQLQPDIAEMHNNLGFALMKNDRSHEATVAYSNAVALKPDSAESHYNLGTALGSTGRHDEAIVECQRAIQLKPDFADAHWNLGLIRLARGELKSGWAEYEWRWKVKSLSRTPRVFTQPRWDGSPLHGKTILLHTEQGFGDAIQFFRYAPLVVQRGGRVVLECCRPLRRLFENQETISQLVDENELPPEFDLYCALLSLPLVMGTDRPEQIPANVPYLHAPRVCQAAWKQKLSRDESTLKIGVAWSGGPKPLGRSISLAQLAPLAEIPGVTFYSLQVGSAAKEARRAPAGMKLIDCSHDLHDFADTAGLIANLDLVISVDTAVAHLAGAMGKPVWTLLKFSPDWRWLLDRDDSPWYPTMRLFRQPRIGDWTAAIDAVAARLRAYDVPRQ